MKHIKLFEQFINEASPKPVEIKAVAWVDFTSSWRYLKYEINGRGAKKIEESDYGKKVFQKNFAEALMKKMKVKGVDSDEFIAWFEKKFEFPFVEVNKFEVNGIEGDLNSFEGKATQW